MATTLVRHPEAGTGTATPTHLSWSDAEGRSHVEPIADGTTIGSGPRCAIRILAEGARPLHCVLRRTTEGILARRWSNDTRLNGKPFTEATLSVGDRLWVAGLEVVAEGDQTEDEPNELDAQSTDNDPSLADLAATDESAEGLEDTPGLNDVDDPPVSSSLATDPQPEASSDRQGDWGPSALANPIDTPSPVTQSSGESGLPIPAHLLNPWRDTPQDGEATPQPAASESPTGSQDAAPDRSIEVASNQGGADATEEPASPQQEPAPVADQETLRLALHNARGRTRRVLRSLRSERAEAAELRDANAKNQAVQHEIAAKLMLATTGLADCQADLHRAKQELKRITVEASDNGWLFGAAQHEVQELEDRVATLHALVKSTEVDRSLVAGQRDLLESDVLKLKSRLADALREEREDSEQSTACAADDDQAIDKQTEEIGSADGDNVADSEWPELSPPSLPIGDAQAVEPVDEQPSSPRFENLPSVATDSANDSTPEPDGDRDGDAAPEINFTDPVEPQSAWTDGAENDETRNDEAGNDETKNNKPDEGSPWSGVWAIEKSDQDSQAEYARPDTAEAAAYDAEQPNANQAATEAWLDSFQSAAPSSGDDQPSTPSDADSTTKTYAPGDHNEAGAEQDFVEEPAPTAHAELPISDAELASEKEETPFEVGDLLAKAGILKPDHLEDDSEPEAAAGAPATPLDSAALAGDIDQPSIDQPSIDQETIDPTAIDLESSQASIDDEQGEFGSLPDAEAPLTLATAATSVEDLIADEQPSAEAPVSFFEKYADTLPQDDASSSGTGPTPPPIEQPAFDEPMAGVGTADDSGEESIEDYMAKLMQRMRSGNAASGESPTAALVEESAAAPAQQKQPQLPESTEEAAAVAPLESLEELRRGPAPERSTDMSSLRALANQSARSAIGVSEVKQDREQATLKLAISGMAMACGGYLAATASNWLDWPLFVGLVAFGWAAYWFYGTLKLRFAAKSKEAAQSKPEPRDELPIVPGQ